MANTKEAIAIILDVGNNMNQSAAGDKSFLDTSLEAIKAILQRKMFAESKDEVALILFGTSETENGLSDGDSYKNISVARDLGLVNWDLLKYIENDIQPSDTTADFVDALVLGMDMLVKGVEGKKGFGSKRLILFSDVSAPFGDDQIDDIVSSLKEAQIELNVIGPSLDDEENDSEVDDKKPPGGASNGQVKEKSDQQRAGEAMLQHILSKVDGECYSFAEALPALAFFQSRQARSMAWKCPLQIGTKLSISVQGFKRMVEAKAKSFKNVYAKDTTADIERARTYHLNDEDRTEVEKPDVVEGHRYGSTLVPFSADDKEAFKMASEKGMGVLGFTKLENIKRHHLLGDSTMTFEAEKDDEAAAVALSAFINAMYESSLCAIVRRVYQKNAKIQLGVLVPHIKLNHECLFYNELPFSEDLRQFTFSSLPVKDTTESNKKFEPSEPQLTLMDQLITDMDLSKADKDEDGEPREALKPKLTFNPYLQRLYQCLQHRALNPDDALQALNATIAAYLEPPREVQTTCSQTVEKLKRSFTLKKTEKKKEEQAAGTVFRDEGGAGEPAPKRAKLDDSIAGGIAAITKKKVTEVGTVTPVDDFKSILADKETDRFEEGCKMMQTRINQIVMESFGTQSYSKAIDCLKALRAESIKSSEAVQFNTFLTEFKGNLQIKGKTDFFDEMITESLSLISKEESSDSSVTSEEKESFLKPEVKKEDEKAPPPAAEEDGDLMDEF